MESVRGEVATTQQPLKAVQVESVCGEFGNPELLALRRDGPAQTLYRVAFRPQDVWGAAECADADAANDVIEVRARARARERARVE